MVDVSRHHELALRPSDIEVDWLHRDDLFDRQRVLQGARREAALIETAARTRADQLLAETAALAEEWLAEIDDECDRLLGGAALDAAEADAARLRAGAADDVAALWRAAEAEVTALRRQTDDELTALWETAEAELDTMLDDARRQAAAIVDAAHTEAAQIRAQAHEELAEARAAVARLRTGLDELLASTAPPVAQTVPAPGPVPATAGPTPVPQIIHSAPVVTATGPQHRPWSSSIRRLLTARR